MGQHLHVFHAVLSLAVARRLVIRCMGDAVEIGGGLSLAENTAPGNAERATGAGGRANPQNRADAAEVSYRIDRRRPPTPGTEKNNFVSLGRVKPAHAVNNPVLDFPGPEPWERSRWPTTALTSPS